MTNLVDRPQSIEPNCQQWQQALFAHQQNRLTNAIDLYQQVIAQNPQFADAYANLAMALSATSEHQAAERAFRRALSLEPKHANNHSNYGFFLHMLGQSQAAEKHLRRAVQLEPQLGIAWLNLGNVLRTLDRWEEAVSCYQIAWPLDSTKLEILSDWLFGLKKTCRLSAQEPVALTLLQASAHELSSGKPSPINPFVACMLPLSLAEFQQICVSQAQTLVDWVQQEGLTRRFPHPQSIRAKPKIKIGYVCAAFIRHPTGHLMEGMFDRHDLSRFEVYGYATTANDGSSYRDRFQQSIAHFREVDNLSNLAIAEQIYSDGIEILVDLDGYTSNHRQGVFALKPAPIQVTWLGFPGTTGASYMDYLIADPVVVPPEFDRFYTEQIVRLPHTYQVNNHRQLPPLAPLDRSSARQTQGLPATGLIFCSFNNNVKIDRHTYQAWLDILKAVPESVLWILVDTAEGVKNLRRAAQVAGVDPARIIPAQWLNDPLAHLHRLQLADLFLDCFICNAHTTATDALWAGVPVLTCVGETFAARVGASLVTAAGLPELICTSPHQFVDRAIHFAQHPDELQLFRDRLQQQKYQLPLFNTDAWVRDFETALLQIYHRDRPDLINRNIVGSAQRVPTNSYSIYIVSPPGYGHVHAFDEFAETLHYAFNALGYLAPIVRTPQEIVGTPIILGANLLPHLANLELPTDSIIFNLEQVYPKSPWFQPGYLDLLKRYQVWDYSERNITALAEVFGVAGVRHCVIGYVPEINRLKPAPEQDIDVLFYGCVNERRQQILHQLQQAGLVVKVLFGVYGENRDRWIERSKLVLNLHFYDAQILEEIRLSYLLANRVCILSEAGADPALAAAFGDGIAFTDYDNLVSSCLALARGAAANRATLAQRGYDLFRQRDFLATLRQMLPEIAT